MQVPPSEVKNLVDSALSGGTQGWVKNPNDGLNWKKEEL